MSKEKVLKFRVNELMAEMGRREGRRVTQSEVQEATGISRSTLSKMSKGTQTRVDIRNLARLMDFFDCEIGELLNYDGAGE